jgi:tRNA (mo5U34)-methyltransferase
MDELGTDEIRRKIEALGPWFHNMRIHGIETAPDHFLGDYPMVKWQRFADSIPQDLTGKTVLDIGCNGGFYSIEMKRRNARHVVGIDHDPHYLRQAAFAASHAGLEIEFHRMSVYELARLGRRFDLVLFNGVFYHLRHPLLALDMNYEHVATDMLVFQSMQRGSEEVARVEEDYPFSEETVFHHPGYPKLHFVEARYSGDPTNWFIPNRAAVEAMLRSAGFLIEAHPEREVYVCRRGNRPDSVEPPPC